MIELVVYVDGVRKSLDLFKDEPINLEMSFAEVQDISSKTGGYTKQFTLPGSKNNNLVFNHFYNPISQGVTYDSRKRYEATILNDGYVLLDGYLRLESATQTKTEVQYSVTFYGEVGDLVSKIADKQLRDLDLSDYNHSYTFENIYNSWKLDESNGYTGLLGGAVVYPLLDRGGLYRQEEDGSETRIKPFDFNLSTKANRTIRTTGDTQNVLDLQYDYFAPAIQLKTLVEEICKQSGFTVESEHMDKLWFKRIYLPLTTTEGQFGLLQNEPYVWTVGREAAFTITGGNTTNLDLVTIIDDENNVWNTGVTPNRISAPRRGYYEIEVSFDYENLTGTDTDIIVGIDNYTSSFTVDNLLVPAAGSESGSGKVKLFAYLEGSYDYTHTFGLPVGGGSVEISNVRTQVLSYPNAIYGQQVNLALNFPQDYKQIDILSSVLKQFNLVIVPKPNDTKILSIEPLRKWIGRGDIVDWTDKLDRGTPITVTDTTKFINGTLELNLRDSNDTKNKTYKEKNDKQFQVRKQPLTTDYRDQVLKIDSKFGVPLSDRITPTNDFTLPAFYSETTEGSGSNNVRTIRKPLNLFPQLIFFTGRRSVKTELRGLMNYDLTQWAGIPTGLKNEIQSWFPQSHHLTYFPVATFSQNRSVGFNKDELQGDYTQIEVHQDSYTIYYKDILDEYLSEESRMLVGSFYLTPEDIKLIDFREKVLVDNTFYRINKITDYNLVEGGMCTVELINLTKDYSIYDYLDDFTDEVRLQACGVGVDDIYTTLGLTPTIYQYTGLVVKVNDVCYRVEQPTQYNPLNTHVPVLLDKDAGNNVLYFVECADCGESGAFCEDTIDIEPDYGTGTNVLGRYVTEEFFGAGFECIIQSFYWDCASGEFLEDEMTGQFQCTDPLGWNDLPSSGTTLIPAPILRDGYLLEECCLDQNTGFYYDVYVEIDTVGGGRAGTMTMHKLCCDTPPTGTTTTTTTVAPLNYLVRDCGDFETRIVSSSTPLNPNDVVYISGTANIGMCWVVITTSSQPATAVVLQQYDNCETCIADNTGGGQSSRG